jgi:hypothetical protein
MDKASRIDLRFAVGSPEGPRSSVWRAYSNKNEVYVSQGMLGGVQKFSFHSSGICRLAFTAQEGPAKGKSDRISMKWRRVAAPPNESIVYVLSVRFPTDYLSTKLPIEQKPIVWVPAADGGSATLVEFIFTRMNIETMMEVAKLGNRALISYDQLPNGEAFVVSSIHQPWIREDFFVPGRTKGGDDLVISADDPKETGRPVRFTRYLDPTSQKPVMCIGDEFGAYRVPSGTMDYNQLAILERTVIEKCSLKDAESLF